MCRRTVAQALVISNMAYHTWIHWAGNVRGSRINLHRDEWAVTAVALNLSRSNSADNLNQGSKRGK